MTTNFLVQAGNIVKNIFVKVVYCNVPLIQPKCNVVSLKLSSAAITVCSLAYSQVCLIETLKYQSGSVSVPSPNYIGPHQFDFPFVL